MLRCVAVDGAVLSDETGPSTAGWAAITYDANGVLHLVFSQSDRGVVHNTSLDGGRTWSPPSTLHEDWTRTTARLVADPAGALSWWGSDGTSGEWSEQHGWTLRPPLGRGDGLNP